MKTIVPILAAALFAAAPPRAAFAEKLPIVAGTNGCTGTLTACKTVPDGMCSQYIALGGKMTPAKGYSVYTPGSIQIVAYYAGTCDIAFSGDIDPDVFGDWSYNSPDVGTETAFEISIRFWFVNNANEQPCSATIDYDYTTP